MQPLRAAVGSVNMSKKILIYRAKPNPAGKDAVQHHTSPQQLLGEWVDLQNTSDTALNLGGFHLANREFDSRCIAKPAPVVYWFGDSRITLQRGEIVRIHTGKEVDSYSMLQADRQGVHYHSFANRGWFVLNNRCGDTISVWSKDSAGNYQSPAEDEASYDPNPPDGEILVRKGNKLVTALVAVLGY